MIADTELSCPTCGDRIDPAGADTLEAIDLQPEDPLGQPDGAPVYFHEQCYPYTSGRYRLSSRT